MLYLKKKNHQIKIAYCGCLQLKPDGFPYIFFNDIHEVDLFLM